MGGVILREIRMDHAPQLLDDPSRFLHCDASDLTAADVEDLLVQYRLLAMEHYFAVPELVSKTQTPLEERLVIADPSESSSESAERSPETIRRSGDLLETRYRLREDRTVLPSSTELSEEGELNEQEKKQEQAASPVESLPSSPSWKAADSAERGSRRERNTTFFGTTKLQEVDKKMELLKSTHQEITQPHVPHKEEGTAPDVLNDLFTPIMRPRNHMVPLAPVMRVGWLLLRKKGVQSLPPNKQWGRCWLVLLCNEQSPKGILRLFDSPDAFEATSVVTLEGMTELQEHPTNL